MVPSMRLTTRVALSGFGIVAAFATGSLWSQLPGLFGSHGIAPIAETMSQLHQGKVSVLQVPTLLWLGHTDFALHLLMATSFISSLCITVGFIPRWACFALFGSWLSMVQVGSPFLNFQWDILLVECSFVFAFLAPNGLFPFRRGAFREPGTAIRFVLAFLACKVTLGSGLVKLTSGDESWKNLTALTYHWWTQPLPTWTSMLGHALPSFIQKLLCALMFLLEVPVPLLALGPRKFRVVSALGMALMQLGLLVAGNYSVFNWLTLVLSLPLLDDAVWGRLLRRRFPEFERVIPRRSVGPAIAWALAGTYSFFSVTSFARRFTTEVPLEPIRVRLATFHVANAYGAFAVMTKSRPEIIVEGSNDGVTWESYEFPWKPGRIDRRPDFVAPLQPRLDWQMWFASLGTCADNPWFLSFQRHLLLGTPEVAALMEHVPFSTPPKFIRSTTYEYRFAPLGEKGVWWSRTRIAPYCPPLALSGDGLRRADEVE